ncbi:RNA polymerase sigma factor [Pseudonocardia kunmingensis]|nr:RNA polymerase sigma factor [Pseudonocardia kunmingensis]
MTSSRAAQDPVELAEFAKFYREAVPGLIGFLRLLGASYPVAADCVQDTMLKALPPVWGTLTHPRAWCRTTCMHAYRRQAARNREDPVADVGLTDHPLLSTDTDFDELEEHFEVVRLLERLPLRRRQVMACVYDGASYDEIAEALGMTPATVRSTHRYAKLDLARLLGENGGGAR